jgi:Xaa-Pro aminopeptidase
MFDPTFDELEVLACGEMGLNIDYFYSLTPRQFTNILIGYRRKEENQEKGKWQRARLAMYYSLLPYSEKKDFSPADVFALTWDDEKDLLQETRKIKTREELEKVFNKKRT